MNETAVVAREHMNISHLLDQELRHIKLSKLIKLAAIIDNSNSWVLLMKELTKPRLKQNKLSSMINLSREAINLIERQKDCGKSPTLALLNHWSITGRRRPTVRILISILSICNLRWAEEYVYSSILNVQPNNQLPLAKQQQSKSKSIDFDIDDIFKFDDLEELVSELKSTCDKYSFKSIYETTNGFCHMPYNYATQTGFKIGEGRFSSVYRAKAQSDTSYPTGIQLTVASKLLKSDCNKEYLVNEINLMRRVRHENLLELLGIALGNSPQGSLGYICLIYSYMQNGSLLDCLSSGLPTNDMEFLTWTARIDIASKVAKGIDYLHTLPDGPIIHRDIKTANILIDFHLEPKIGDFTLVRQLDGISSSETQNIIGTSAYMPREAFQGDISIKFDIFSFGIVLLELLTGLKPFDDEVHEDLLTYITGQISDVDDESEITGIPIEEGRDKFLITILDKKAGIWNFQCSKTIFELALLATESNKNNRPEMLHFVTSLSPLAIAT